MALPRAPEAGTAGDLTRLSGLVQACPELQHASRILVAFSGGLDSTVLLHMLHQARTHGLFAAPLHALHVNHVMQPDAERWQTHCHGVCAALGIEFEGVRAPVVALPGKSLEETARDVRHAVFEARLKAGDVLTLAQHRDDQAETVLFRLLRGSGVGGLAGMPRSRACGDGTLVRPLLGLGRAELSSYAQAHALAWVEDGSNADPRFDRNFLRTTIMPLLHQRWPGLAATVARSAELAGEAAELLDELAVSDLGAATGTQPGQLAIGPLQSLGEARQRNALRYWLQDLCARRGYAKPTFQVLARITAELIPAKPDAEPMLAWGEGNRAVELRRHRGLLHALAPLPPVPPIASWTTEAALTLPAPLGSLELQASDGPGLPRERIPMLRVCFRSGGELVKPAGRPTRPLKKILQDAGVPPWLRERIPLLYCGNEMVAVADLLVCEGWLEDAPENPCRIVWRHPDLDCGYPPHLLI